MKPSDAHYEKALRLIPWGTQTNAKRHYPFFEETMPKFIERGKGCRIWDMEGKEYIDYRLALGPVTLGYCYDEVDDAVRAQMKKGQVPEAGGRRAYKETSAPMLIKILLILQVCPWNCQ